MDALSPTAQTLHASMAKTGTVLPAFMVNDDNRAEQQRQLQLLAGLVGLAHANGAAIPLDTLTTETLFDALDGKMGLKTSGVFAFSELLEILGEAHSRAVNPPFPVPGIPTVTHPDGEPAEETFGIDLSGFDGTLSARQARIWVDLLAETVTLAQKRYPWRAGTTPEDHAEPFVPGRPPEEPTI
ncbi:MAG: hypothetical protein ACI8S6_003728 [Myxococcota bacterium]|jgi:hypothetical protein